MNDINLIDSCQAHLDKNKLQRMKHNLIRKIITCDLSVSIYMMDHPDLAVSNFMGNPIGLKSVKNLRYIPTHLYK